MELLRDPFWQSVGAVTAILALFLYVYVERDKISRIFTEVLTQLRSTLVRLSNLSPAIVRSINILLNIIFLSLLAIFILIAPIFLYKELILHQVLYIDPYIIDNRSMIYGLVVIVWCISIMTFRYKLILDELRAQIDYLNRIPDIKELKNKYNRQLFDSAIRQWNDFRAELVHKHDDSPFAIDLVTCSLLNVQDETLIIGCPNSVTHKRLSKNPLGDDKEYDEKMRDKRLIEALVKKQFQVRKISYILKK
jgi:hypothetical protein